MITQTKEKKILKKHLSTSAQMWSKTVHLLILHLTISKKKQKQKQKQKKSYRYATLEFQVDDKILRTGFFCRKNFATFTFTEEILNGKFFFSVCFVFQDN